MNTPPELLYIKIYQKIKQQIQANPALYRLSSERKLAEEYQVSRITIRHAIKLLVDNNLIQKKSRSANFINFRVLKHDLVELKSLKEEMEFHGLEYTVTILHFEKISVPLEIAKILQIQENDCIYFIKRIISIDNVPMIYEESYIPVYLFPNMAKTDAIVKYDYIETYLNINIKQVHKKISVIIPSKEITQLLELKNIGVLYINMYTELENMKVCEYVIQYFHPNYILTSITKRK